MQIYIRTEIGLITITRVVVQITTILTLRIDLGILNDCFPFTLVEIRTIYLSFESEIKYLSIYLSTFVLYQAKNSSWKD